MVRLPEVILRFIHRAARAISSRFRNFAYRMLGVRIKGYCWLRQIEIPQNWSDIAINNCALDRGVTLLCSGHPKANKLRIGEGTYVNRNTMFDVHDGVSVGCNVMIGPYCYITDGDHGTKGRMPVKQQPMRTAPVAIEDDAWIGAHVSILKGVRIGRGAVVGTGSVVTKSVPDYAIVVGVPAKLVRIRNEN